MRRRRKNSLLLFVAVALVVWFVLSRARLVFYVPLTITNLLIFVGVGIVLVYLALRLIF